MSQQLVEIYIHAFCHTENIDTYLTVLCWCSNGRTCSCPKKWRILCPLFANANPSGRPAWLLEEGRRYQLGGNREGLEMSFFVCVMLHSGIHAVAIMTSLPATTWRAHLQNHVAPANLVHAPWHASQSCVMAMENAREPAHMTSRKVQH